MNLTTQEFKDKIFNYEEEKEWKFKGEKAVTIRFTASWCLPCKSYAPVYIPVKENYYIFSVVDEFDF